MKIDLTCPVELWQYAMPGEADAECTFVMNNLSDKVVTSVQVTLNGFDQNDELLFRQTERVQGLKAGVGERFTVVVLPSEWNGVKGIDLVIEKVWFDDATIWRKGNAPLIYYTPNLLKPGRALDELRFVAGKDAVGYPQWQEAVWTCVCGRPNALESERCCRCERRRDAVFASFNQENVSHINAAHEQKLAETARKAREENNLLQENQEKQRAARRRRRNRLIRWTGTVALLAAAAVITVVWGIPTVQYNTALDLLKQGYYDQASAAFGEMGDYRDAMTQTLECAYQKALSLFKQGGTEALEEAERLFEELEDYADSEEQLLHVRYDLGSLYLQAGSYELAVEQFQSLGDYLDSAEKGNETIYQQADNMLKAGSHEAARVLFAGLGAYSDAVEKVNECTYRMAEMHMKAEEYQQAIALLATFTDHPDAALLLGQCHYMLAEAELAAGEFEAAGEWFLAAGDYEDANVRANECLYRLAQEKRENGEYEKAMELFLRIPDYEDSVELAQQCVYDQADAMAEAGDLANAIALFESITGFADVPERLDECRFHLAEEVLASGDTMQAERLLASISEYKGLEAQLKKVRYQLAGEKLEAGEYEAALDRYAQLGNYKDSQTRAKQCRYAIAKAAQENGEYEQAIELYTELGNYKDSQSCVKQCRYAMAQALMEKAEYDKAISLFEQLGSYEDSKNRMTGAQYQRAMAMKEQGSTAEAMLALETMDDHAAAAAALKEMRMAEAAHLEAAGDYDAAAQLYAAVDDEEAKKRYQACRYALAEALYKSGDLPGAAAAFHELAGYEDAAERSEACYNEYYGQVAQSARDAGVAGDYVGVIAALNGFEMTVLSENYDDLPKLLAQACLQAGDQLYADGRPYEAIPYYQHAGAQEKLERRAYLILGEWESATGKTAAFRTDGTCTLMDEELYFRVSNFSLYTGKSPEEMTITHKISVLDQKGMSLRDQRDGQDVLYKLSRVGDFVLPEMRLPEHFPVQEESVPETTPEPTQQPVEPTFEPIITPAPEQQAVDELLVTEEAADE